MHLRGRGARGGARAAEQPPAPPEDQQKAYNEAMRMLRYEGSSTWQRFAAFLVAHGFFAGFLVRFGLGPWESRGRLFVLFLAAVLGFFASLAWWSVLERSTALFDLRMHQAKRFEPGSWALLEQGELLSEKGCCEVNVKEVDAPVQMPLVGRGRMRGGPRVVIWCFSAFYFALGCYFFYEFIPSRPPWEIPAFCVLGIISIGAFVVLSLKTKGPKPATRRSGN